MTPEERRNLLPAARGDEPADILFAGGEVFNPFTCEWIRESFAVSGGYVIGTGGYRAREVRDISGKRVVPGLVDAHVHIESSLLAPAEYARLVSSHGTTTVIADPHEIANTCGSGGIEWMLAAGRGLPVDIFWMLPSCVPATPLDPGGAELGAGELSRFTGRDRVTGLGEVMNVPGVLSGDKGVWEKLGLFRTIDGHAPLLSGAGLNAYILAGMQSDHECTGPAEAREKLRKGMYVFIREGSTEQNLRELAGIVTPASACRCSFATDDRHADLLASAGHIDDCIRKAIGAGVEPELALRMATLSPAERFGLSDRGAVAPGRIADFCIVDRDYTVQATFKGGRPAAEIRPAASPGIRYPFRSSVPDPGTLAIAGEGTAHVIGIVEGQILTRDLRIPVSAREIPDLSRDILKVAVCSRYSEGPCSTGLVHGFGFSGGAIASSIAHDSHNVIAAGVSDREIHRAIALVIRNRGAMAAVSGNGEVVLPLPHAGLMAGDPWEEVVRRTEALKARTGRFGGIPDPFMYLSFLALPVIPNLRITPNGLFDAGRFAFVPLFETDEPGDGTGNGRDNGEKG